jgi:hypothetical protein
MRSWMNRSRSRGRMRHWAPSFAAVSSRVLIQRRTVLVETRQRAATSSIVRSCSGTGLVVLLIVRPRGVDRLLRGRSHLFGYLLSQETNELRQGARLSRSRLLILLAVLVDHRGGPPSLNNASARSLIHVIGATKWQVQKIGIILKAAFCAGLLPTSCLRSRALLPLGSGLAGWRCP